MDVALEIAVGTRPAQDAIVCRCLHVTAAALIEALESRPISTLQEVIHCTGAGDGCTACHRVIREYLQRRSYSSSPSPICSCK
ncbi:MAG: (2Fe-2S)-binding protein [Planctomycetes bacterium]|nr:(2Fe-2S)-binding protein [Planctomycetota bacterium]